MEEIFTSDERAADLISWAEKLNGLGNIIEALGYGNASVEYHCKILGPIVSEYAHAIEATLSAVYPKLNKLFDGFETISLGGIDREYKDLKKMPDCPGRKTLIKKYLEEIHQVKEKVAFVFDIEKDLKKMMNRAA